MNDNKDTWKRVNKSHPCSICGRPDFCTYSADGNVVYCRRDTSGTPHKSGKGSLHFAKKGSGDRKRNDTPSGTDWMPERERRGSTRPKTTKPPQELPPGEGGTCAGGKGKIWPTEADAIAALVAQAGTLAGTWRYTDETGQKHLFTRIRIDLHDGTKTYRPIRPYKGKWKVGNPRGKLPLYKVAEVRGLPVVCVVEGEKCADAGWKLGLACVTSADGADGAGKADWSPLAGRDVVIFPDADEPGEKYAMDVAKRLLELSPPARVRIVRLPDLDEGEDLVDWIEANPDLNAEDFLSEIGRLSDAAKPIVPADVMEAAVMVNLADVKTELIRWLWPGRIAAGKLTLIAGDPGTGKSTFTIHIAAVVTTGGSFPDAPGHRVAPGKVLLMGGEDDLGDTVRPRLEFAGGDPTKFEVLTGVKVPKAGGQSTERSITMADVPIIESALKHHPDAKLLIIDPVGEFTGKTDANSDNEMRALLRELRRMAETYGIAVVLVAHTNKRSGAPAMHRVLGSIGLIGICRQAWVVVADPKDKNRRLLLLIKGNIGRRDGLAFTVELDPANPDVGRVLIDPTPITESADEIMAATAEKSGDGGEGEETADRKGRLAEAASFLRAELAAGPVKKTDLHKTATEADITWGTIRRAKRLLRIKPYREGGKANGPWWWELPPVEPLPQDRPTPDAPEGDQTEPADPHT